MKQLVVIVSQIVISLFFVSANADVRIYNKSHHPVYFSLGNPRTHPSSSDLTSVNARRNQVIGSFPATYTQLLLSRSPKPGRGSRLNTYTFNREYNPVIWVDIERDGSTINPSKDAPADNVSAKDIAHSYTTVGNRAPDNDTIELFSAIVAHDFSRVQTMVKRLYHLEVGLPEGVYAAPLNRYHKEAFTPLLAALDQKQYRIARYLINNGANAQARTLSGTSGLDLAAQAQDAQMIKLLHRQQVSLQDENFLRAVTHAGNIKILEYIEKHGAQLSGVPNLPPASTQGNVGD